ncbi:MAG: UvrD-helicase domain-containing protein [Candidatus Acidiferrales bacterium]|jgi:DNA helicase-2/ATP-dependent DNA helicase PcrA
MTLLDELNPRQREAVVTTEGPVLVLAGAGTGKTRAITYRVAHLIEKGVPPGAILAVTFTNKAAGVMKDRIRDLLRASGRDASDVWVSTFHSFCARLLRREARHAGLPRDFAIYDDDDQVSAVKRALLQLDLSAEDFPPRSLRAQISHAKNHGITPDEMESEAQRMQDRDRRDVARVFRAYNEILRKAAAVDFDDLLLRAVELLREHPEVRAAWSARFQYLMVDEFQDTNQAQEELVRLLAGTHRNVCVVGDEDQSIYGWRGARAGNLKRFTEDFPDAKIIRLEENYRSTQTILDAAAAVVKNNSDRLGKNLQGTLGSGDRLRFFEAQDSMTEADFVCGEISAIVRNDPHARVAVLYRTGAQSRSFEEVLRRLAIRHRVVGGFSFYERAEVRNALAYVRLLFHPEDDVALLRVLNVPPRGIGAATVGALEARAKETGSSLWEVIRGGELATGKRLAGALNSFRELIEGLREECIELPPAQMIERVLDRTGYLDWVEQQDNLEHTSRAENLRELSNAMAEATEQGQTLEDLLDHAALVADSDEYDETIPVSLMTLHSAKGLEFDAVFLAGLEEGILPHSRSIDTNAEIEEERRLFYVGMTRAKRSLVLSRAIYRRSYGEERLRASLPSRFLAEIPGDLIEAAAGSESEPGETRRYEPDPEYSEGYAARRPRPSYGQTAYGRGAAGRSSYGRPNSGRPAPTARTSKDPLVGARVRHSKYGLGTVIEVEGEGEERKLTVSFQDYGPKKLIERYANLQLA